MKNFKIDFFSLLIAILLTWTAYSLHVIAKNGAEIGRYQNAGDGIIDTKTGELWIMMDMKHEVIKPKKFSGPIE